jgi:hypothetical protein
MIERAQTTQFPVRIRSTLAILLLGVYGLALALPGCNIVGPAAYLIEGPPSVDAEYTLKDVPTLVFIDDRQNVVNPISLRRVIADSASTDLMVKKCVKTTISGQDAMVIVAQQERNSKILSMEEIGQKVGARQIIYIEMTQFSDSPDGVTPRPVAAGKVRVIDLDAHERTFPPKDAEQPFRMVQAAGREVDINEYRTLSTRLPIFENLAKEMGVEVAKLFYKHEVRQLGGKLKSR